MSKLGVGVRQADKPFVYVLDMRDEIITSVTQFVEAIARFQIGHLEKISTILLCPTQEYCLRLDMIESHWNTKEKRPYRRDEVDKLGPLQFFMGYEIYVKVETD